MPSQLLPLPIFKLFLCCQELEYSAYISDFSLPLTVHMDLKFTNNCFPSSHRLASCFAVYPLITYPRRAWVLDSFKCLNENSAGFHVWIHLLFLGTVWSFKHWTCYWVQVCVLNTQWGPKNWNMSLEQRKFCCRPKQQREQVAHAQKTPRLPKVFQQSIKKKKNLCWSIAS